MPGVLGKIFVAKATTGFKDGDSIAFFGQSECGYTTAKAATDDNHVVLIAVVRPSRRGRLSSNRGP